MRDNLQQAKSPGDFITEFNLNFYRKLAEAKSMTSLTPKTIAIIHVSQNNEPLMGDIEIFELNPEEFEYFKNLHYNDYEYHRKLDEKDPIKTVRSVNSLKKFKPDLYLRVDDEYGVYLVNEEFPF